MNKIVLFKTPVAGEIHLAFLYELMDRALKKDHPKTRYQAQKQANELCLPVAADHQIIV
jgi:hypothetical protein